MSKIPSIIVDLDGTLCNIEHRVHHVQKQPKDWKSFNMGIDRDKSYFWCQELIAAMRGRGYQILFVSGRTEDLRGVTEEWLARHQVLYDKLYLRQMKDYREDSDVKEEIYHNYIQASAAVLFVVDDRQIVVDRWRKLDLICLQCAPGNF